MQDHACALTEEEQISVSFRAFFNSPSDQLRSGQAD